ncbi:hypothetical protein [Pseudonocardia lacus]|uniref:hypothetical protein n=1 Tax=Pseudonocardia lacus TaxID=2835865 RepID=UPI001BDCA671|nr:hypothetical protein [Pseudonocardia lacus]
MAAIDPADTARLVTRARRRGTTVLVALAVGAAAGRGAAVEAASLARGVEASAAHAAGMQHAGVALLLGLVVVLVVHAAVAAWARGRLDDRLEREWAEVEPHWSHRRAA